MALSASVPGASRVLTLDDTEAGDRILVVPARAGRGMLTPKRFVELMVLPSAAGLAVIPYADDIQATVREETVRFSRPQGLALSAGSGAATEPAVQVAESKEGADVHRLRAMEPAGQRRARYDQVARGRRSRACRKARAHGRGCSLRAICSPTSSRPKRWAKSTSSSPTMCACESDTALQVMKGAAQYMMGRYGDARLTLSAASLGIGSPRGVVARHGGRQARRFRRCAARSADLAEPCCISIRRCGRRARGSRAPKPALPRAISRAPTTRWISSRPCSARAKSAEAELMQAQLLGAQGHANEAVARLARAGACGRFRRSR